MKIALLGGGITVNYLALALEEKFHQVHSYLSPRHAAEEISEIPLVDLLNQSGLKYTVVESEKTFREAISNQEFDLVLGLGPAWVISRDTLKKAKMWVNINPIPIPKFMGGAHSTWQILNQESLGSIIFQKMDFPVDRGCVLAKYDFLYKPEHRTPQARIEENLRQIITVIHEALHKVMTSDESPEIALDFSSREYWPRLNSEVHGWIDWNWSGEEIANFVGAFGLPYIGAHSNLLENTIYFKSAEFIEIGQIHPFSAGIILRQDGENQFTIAVRGGHLKVTTKPISNLTSVFLEGLRFHSPISKLDFARSTNLRSKDL